MTFQFHHRPRKQIIRPRTLICVLLVCLFALPTEASHFRFSNLAWRRAAGSTNSLEIDIIITEAWRKSDSSPRLGLGELDYTFGDNTGTFDSQGATLQASLTDLSGEEYKVWTKNVTHTYPSNGVYVVTDSSGDRIRNLINAGSQNFRLTMNIDLRSSNNGSPFTQIPAIIQMGINTNNSVQLPIFDNDNDSTSVRMATALESSIPTIAAIGENALIVTPGGLLKWNTSGGSAGDKYAVQVVVEENHLGTGTGQVPLDFIVELVDGVANRAPICVSPTNTLFAAEAGSAVSFLVTAQDPEGGPLEIDLIGPAGSTISPAANTVISNSPAMVQFSWIPPASSTNQSRLVTMIFRDNAGLQTQCTFAINVTAVNAPPQFGLVSTDSTGVIRGSGASLTPSVSDDGRFVAFASQASNLIFGDSNGRMDIFRHDRITGKIVLVSVNTTGTAAAGDSSNPSISATGQQILFESTAEDLTANDSNGRRDVFIRDLSLNTTELVSVGVNGTSPTGDSFSSLMSDDGRTVAFVSVATNVVSNDHNNGADVFVRLRNSGTTVLASRTATGTSGNGSSSQPAIAPGGNYVAFVSVANNLVANDSNGAGDVFRFSVIDSTVGLASTTGSASANNVSFSPTVNSAGSVAFASQATNLTAEVNTNRVTDVFVRNFGTATTRLVSGAAAGGVVGNGGSGNPIFSPDGSQVLFTSVASDLVAGDTDAVSDVFLYHVTTLNKELISVAGSGSGDGASSVAPGGMSDDLRYVVFTSAASNLTPGDTNGANDVFLRDRTAGATVLLSRGTNSATGGNGASSSPFVSGNGSALVFASHANNLVANDTNALADIFAIATANSLSAFVTLSVRSAGADIHLEWPALQGGYHIEESSAVAPASNWTPATLPITTTNGVFRAVATPSPGPVYFQLRQTSGTR